MSDPSNSSGTSNTQTPSGDKAAEASTLVGDALKSAAAGTAGDQAKAPPETEEAKAAAAKAAEEAKKNETPEQKATREAAEKKAAEEAAKELTPEEKAAKEARDKELGELRGAPEDYAKDLKVPEGMQLDKPLMEAMTPVLRKLDLSSKGAQEIVDVYAKSVLPELQARAVQAWHDRQETWVNEIKADKVIGGANLEKAKGVMAKGIIRFCTTSEGNVDQKEVESLQKALVETGAGNHPAIVRHFYRIGKAVGEDTIERGGVTKPSKSAADSLYGPGTEIKQT